MWNSTIAEPSLSSDSPVISALRSSDTPAFCKIANTATGSVGEIRAPKTRQSMMRIPSIPKSPINHHEAKPTTAVDTSIPRVANIRTGIRSRVSALISTEKAPAKIRKESATSKTNSEKSNFATLEHVFSTNSGRKGDNARIRKENTKPECWYFFNFPRVFFAF